MAPPPGDRCGWAITELILEVEKDSPPMAREVKFGGGKPVIRDGMGQGTDPPAPLSAVDHGDHQTP